MSARCKDLTGMIFGRLTVIERGTNDSHGAARWICKCECGNVKLIRGDKLRSGEIVSCGCYQSECRKSTERSKQISEAKIQHGLSNTKLYYVYNNMMRRCYDVNNSKYNNYGKRGIVVCDEWKEDRIKFFKWAIENGYQDGLTLDRIDVNGIYSPENCRWATQKVQANNKTNNSYITYNGITKTLSEWSDTTGISISTLWSRKQRGWDSDMILNTSV